MTSRSEPNPNNPLRTALALMALSAYVVTNVVGANAAESAFWAERRRARDDEAPRRWTAPRDLGLPPVAAAPSPDGIRRRPAAGDEPAFAALTADRGAVRSIVRGRPGGPWVLFVQDVHRNADAQRNIGAVVAALAETRAVDLVALEGAFGPIELSKWRSHPRRETVRSVADVLREEGKISGPVHAALTGAAALPLLGIDDAGLHAANVAAFQRAAGWSAAVSAELRERRKAAARAAVRVRPDLRALASRRAAREAGRLGLGDYATGLLDRAAGVEAPEAVRRFVGAVRAEAGLDFERAEAERAAALAALSERMDDGERESLLARALEFRAGRLSHADFHRALWSLGARHGVTAARYPEFARYVDYVLQVGRVDGEALHEGLRALETALERRGASPAETEWLAADRRRSLDVKLAGFALSPAEWRERIAEGTAGGVWRDFEDFYRTAGARDAAMAAGLLRALSERGARRAVLVAGGFHAPGITAALARAGATVVSFAPRIGTVDRSGVDVALSVFNQEKTPLEKIAAGERLFLAPPPAAGLAEAPFAAAALEGSEDTLRRLYDGVTPLERVTVRPGALRARFATGEEVDVRVLWEEGRPRFLQRAGRSLRDVFWRPLAELPAALAALGHRAAFRSFLAEHPIVLRPGESGRAPEIAERLFRQRHAGLSEWLPAGVTIGIGFGAGALLTALALAGGALLAKGLLPLLFTGFFLSLLLPVSGGVAGLYLGHVAYNLTHPRARLASPSNLDPHLAPRLHAVRLGEGVGAPLSVTFFGHSEVRVPVHADSDGPLPQHGRAFRLLRDVLWRPAAEIPAVVRALLRPSDFVEFLARHPIVLSSSELDRTVRENPSYRPAMEAAAAAVSATGAAEGWSPRVGAVLLSGDGRIVARGHNRGEGPHHAEQAALLALLDARAPRRFFDHDLLRLQIWPLVSRWSPTFEFNYREMIDLYFRAAARRGIDLSDVTVVTTLSPCRRCADLMAGLGVKRVVFGEPTPDAENVLARLRARGVEVESCSLGPTTRSLRGWIFGIERRFPFFHRTFLSRLGGRQWPADFLRPSAEGSMETAEFLAEPWREAEGIFRQRYSGLTRWIPTGLAAGLAVGAGAAVATIDPGMGWAVKAVWALAGLAIGGVAGLYLGHVAYNLTHPRARLALDPGPVRFSFEPGVIDSLRKDPAGLQNALARLAAPLAAHARDVRIGQAAEPSIQLERDRGFLSLRLRPADLLAPAAFELAARRLIDRLNRSFGEPVGERIVAFPVVHQAAEDFPGGALSRYLAGDSRRKITLFQEIGALVPDEALLEGFQRDAEGFAGLLFGPPGAFPTVSLDALVADARRSRWWRDLYNENLRRHTAGLAAVESAMASGEWPRLEALLGPNPFHRALQTWLFENRERARAVRENVVGDSEFLRWQRAYLEGMPWREGPWSTPGLSPREAVSALAERVYQGELLYVKAAAIRNARLLSRLRRLPINPDVQGVLVIGAAHFYGLRDDLFAWLAPDARGRPGEGTSPERLSRVLNTPSGRLHRQLIAVFNREFPSPADEDLAPYSDWVRRVSAHRPAPTPAQSRWVLEILLSRWVARARKLSWGGVRSVAETLPLEAALSAAVADKSDEELRRWLEDAAADTPESNQRLWNLLNESVARPEIPDSDREAWARALGLVVQRFPFVVARGGVRVSGPAPAETGGADVGPVLSALADGLAARSRAREVVLGVGPAGARWARDGSRLWLSAPAAAYRSAETLRAVLDVPLARLEAVRSSADGVRVRAYPVRHVGAEDFPGRALDELLAEAPDRRLTLLQEIGSLFPADFLAAAFHREPAAYAAKLFGPGDNPLDLAALASSPERRAWFEDIYRRRLSDALRGNESLARAVAERRPDRARELLGGSRFNDAFFDWVYERPGRAQWEREATSPDVEAMHWQSVWLEETSWRDGPWAAHGRSPERDLEASLERLREIQLLAAKRLFLRNARWEAWVRARPVDSSERLVLPIGAAHRGLSSELFRWVDAPADAGTGRGTDRATLESLLALPESRLQDALVRRLADRVAAPEPGDTAEWSPWALNAAAARPSRTAEGERWLLEILAARLINRPDLWGGERVRALDDAVVQSAVALVFAGRSDEELRDALREAFEGTEGPGRFRKRVFDRLAEAAPEDTRAISLRKALGVLPRQSTPPVALGPVAVAAAAETLAEDLARAASARLVALQSEAPRSARTKSDGSRVSRADVETLVDIAEGIFRRFPDHEIVWEEDLSTAAPELDRRTRANAGSAYQWFVDSLDGTEAYLDGREEFSVLVGLLHEGRPVAAAVALPRKAGPDGRALVATARLGRPGLRVNGRDFAPAPADGFTDDLKSQTAVSHGKPAVGEPYPHFDRVERAFGRTIPRVGSSGLWMAALALRRVGLTVPGTPEDLAVYATSGRLRSWDIVAPGVLLDAAGGALEEHDRPGAFFPLRQSFAAKDAKLGVLAAASPGAVAAFRRSVLAPSSGGGDRAGPSARVEIVRPARVAKADLRLCFFDVNGTLWRGYPYDLKATLWAQFLHAADRPSPEQVAAIERFFIETDWMSWSQQEEALGRWAWERGLTPVEGPAGRAHSDAVRVQVNREMLSRAAPERAVPGVGKLVEALVRAGVRLEVSTSGSPRTRSRVIERLGLRDAFAEIHGGGKKAETLRERMAALGRTGREVAMIGDGRGDMTAARANGALAVGIASDEIRATQLREAGADVIVHGDYSDLAGLREALGLNRTPPVPRWRALPGKGGVRILAPPRDRRLVFPAGPRFSRTVDHYRAVAAGMAVGGDYLRAVPLLRLPMLSDRLGLEVLLSDQGRQPTGSFKPWILAGLFGRVARDPAAFAREFRHLTTPTTGNQGQSLAFFAAFLRRTYPDTLGALKAVVFVPRNAPPQKIELMRRLGADIRIVEDYAAAEAASLAFAEAEGAYYLAHGDEAAVESYAALGLDLLTETARWADPGADREALVGRWAADQTLSGEGAPFDPGKTAVLVPIGAGGVAAGVAFAWKSVDPRLTVVGVDSDRADPMSRSLRRGQVETVSPGADILENGIAVNAPEPLAFETARGLLDAMVTVPHGRIAGAVRAHWEQAGVVSEGAAVLPYAALANSPALVDFLRSRGVERVVLLGTGRNIPPALWTSLTGSPMPAEDPYRRGGMHHVGEPDLTPEQWTVLRGRVRREATALDHRRWAGEIRAGVERHRAWLTPAGLTDALLDLAARLEGPPLRAPGLLNALGIRARPAKVRWFLLDSPAGKSWEHRLEGAGERVPPRGRASEEVRLYATGLAAVVHEGLEHWILAEKPGLHPRDRHTLAFLAEAVANRWDDVPVPSRALEELGRRRGIQLVRFLENYRAEFNAVRRRFADRPFLRARLEAVAQALRRYAGAALEDARHPAKWALRNDRWLRADEAYWTGNAREFGESLRAFDRAVHHAADGRAPSSGAWRGAHDLLRWRIERGSTEWIDDDFVPARLAALSRVWDRFDFPEMDGLLAETAGRVRGARPPGGTRELFRFWAAAHQVVEPVRARGDWTEFDALLSDFAQWVRRETVQRGLGAPYWERTVLRVLRDLSGERERALNRPAAVKRDVAWAFQTLNDALAGPDGPTFDLSTQRSLLALLAGGEVTELERAALFEKGRALLPRVHGRFRNALEDVVDRSARFPSGRDALSPIESVMASAHGADARYIPLLSLLRDYLEQRSTREAAEALISSETGADRRAVFRALTMWDEAFAVAPFSIGRLHPAPLQRTVRRALRGAAGATVGIFALGLWFGFEVDPRWWAPLWAPALLFAGLRLSQRTGGRASFSPIGYLARARPDAAVPLLEMRPNGLHVNAGLWERWASWPRPLQWLALYGTGLVAHEEFHRGGVHSEAAAYGAAQALPALIGAVGAVVAFSIAGLPAGLAALLGLLGAPLASAALGHGLEWRNDRRALRAAARETAAALRETRAGRPRPLDLRALIGGRPLSLGLNALEQSAPVPWADRPGFAGAVARGLASDPAPLSAEDVQESLVLAALARTAALEVTKEEADVERPLTVVLVTGALVPRLPAVVSRALSSAPAHWASVALVPLDEAGARAVAQLPADRRVARWDSPLVRSARGWSLGDIESRVRLRVALGSFSVCRLVADARTPLYADGFSTPLFRNAVVWLLHGLLPLTLHTEELDRLSRLSNLIAAAA